MVAACGSAAKSTPDVPNANGPTDVIGGAAAVETRRVAVGAEAAASTMAATDASVRLSRISNILLGGHRPAGSRVPGKPILRAGPNGGQPPKVDTLKTKSA